MRESVVSVVRNANVDVHSVAKFKSPSDFVRAVNGGHGGVAVNTYLLSTSLGVSMREFYKACRFISKEVSNEEMGKKTKKNKSSI